MTGGPTEETWGRYSTQVSPSTRDRVRATVRGVRRVTDTDYTLRQLTEEALARHCEHLEATYNDGEPWPTDNTPLRPGRL